MESRLDSPHHPHSPPFPPNSSRLENKHKEIKGYLHFFESKLIEICLVSRKSRDMAWKMNLNLSKSFKMDIRSRETGLKESILFQEKQVFFHFILVSFDTNQTRCYYYMVCPLSTGRQHDILD